MKSTIGSLIGIALNLIRVGGRRDIQKVGDILYLWLIHVNVGQKPTQYSKAVVLQLKINKPGQGSCRLVYILNISAFI